MYFLTHSREYATFYLASPDGEGMVEERLAGPRLEIGDGSSALRNPHFISDFYAGRLQVKGFASLSTPVASGT